MSKPIIIEKTDKLNNVNASEVSQLTGVTSNIQQQLNAKIIDPASKTSGQVLQYNGTDWAAANVNTLQNICDGSADYSLLLCQNWEGWAEEGYKTLAFTEAPTGNLLTWLQSNATNSSGNTWVINDEPEMPYYSDNYISAEVEFTSNELVFSKIMIGGNLYYEYQDDDDYYDRMAYTQTLGTAAVAINAASAPGWASFAVGYNTAAVGDVSYAEGEGTAATGYASHAEGWFSIANENDAHAEGSSTLSNGYASHSEGVRTYAGSYASHAEGYLTSVAYEAGMYAHAEGQETNANGQATHAEGANTTASNLAAHAEGVSTTARGQASHSEGNQTTSSGFGSHAEGSTTQATALGAHAEGYNTKATASQAHAEGDGTEASGTSSHAEGLITKATKTAQHVSGRFNVADTGSGEYGTYAQIVGNGTDQLNLSNAYTLDWSGNGVFAGNVTAQIFNGGMAYTTEAPTSANTQGIKIAVLSTEPATKYSGWLYLITG